MQPLQPAQYQLLKWVDAFRWNGHLFADINPLKNIKKEQQSDDTHKQNTYESVVARSARRAR